ncbi:putative quinol monooxygenase [Psychromonas sp. KJ10-2]|uniref:putative quinol monooxygenase n=1 Tax=Psychromonas sp. KJ10-2 TaxID=3391822 RepID=UPI0039B4405E
MINAITGNVSITAELKIKETVEIYTGLRAIQQFCDDMNSEEGCLFAIAHQDNEDPRKIILWEIYKDKAAFDAHFIADHTKAFFSTALTEFVKAYETEPVANILKGDIK